MTLLLTCEGLSKSYTSQPLFKDISFSIFKDDKIGVIGPNGSGKSTFFKILAGLETADSGKISMRRSVRVGYVPQYSEFTSKSIEDILVEALAQDQSISEYEIQSRALVLMDKAGFENPSQDASQLSGGWKKRLDIIKEVAKSPDILLFDEPTNHLDLEGILWLEKFLQEASFTYLIITHDRLFLEHIANRMLELEKTYPGGLFEARGTYSDFLQRREDFFEHQARQERSLNSKVRREVEWLKQNPKARTTKSQSRVQEANRLIDQLSDLQTRNKKSVSQLEFEATERDTKKLLAATNIAKSYGDKKLFEGVTLTLSTGTRLGIAGVNGSGKSTFLKILAGEIKQDKGTIKCADGLKIAYFDQHREQLPLDITLKEALSGVSDTVNYRGQSIHVNGWCRRFLFTPDRLELPVKQLSGGERARVLIARLMLQPADILLLDEPTNDLDIPTLEILEASLKEFSGAVVLITHDRYLLDQVSTSILGLGPNGQFGIFADYNQWENAFPVESKKAPKSAKKQVETVKKEQAPNPGKLSFKEKKELEVMENLILETEKKIAELEQQAYNPSLQNNSQQLDEVYRNLHSAQTELEKLFARWQELESKKLASEDS